MDETHVCVVDREGVVIHEGKSASTSQSIPDELAKAPSCRRIVFETGRMAPILFHGLNQLDLPVCREPAGLSGAQVECGTLGATAGHTWSATDETVEIFVEADTNELPEERRRFALIQHPSPPVQPSNRRGHETKERKASIAEKSAQPSTLP
jgi:hypothetical protein